MIMVVQSLLAKAAAPITEPLPVGSRTVYLVENLGHEWEQCR